MVTNDDVFRKLQHILELGESFHGTITCCTDDIEKDGGAKKLFSSIVKKPAINLIRRIRRPSATSRREEQPGDSPGKEDEPYQLAVEQYNSEDQSVVKFYYQSKIMEAVDSSVFMKTLVSPTTPKEGKFMIECPTQQHCRESIGTSPSHMKNEIDEYLVLKKDDKNLTCVHKDLVTDDKFYSLITIYNTDQDHPNPDKPDTAIFFSDKKYHYYLVPQDCTRPECDIMVKKVDVEGMNDDEIDEQNRKHLSFVQKYSNNGGGTNGIIPSHKQQHYGNGGFKLSGPVERD